MRHLPRVKLGHSRFEVTVSSDLAAFQMLVHNWYGPFAMLHHQILMQTTFQWSKCLSTPMQCVVFALWEFDLPSDDAQCIGVIGTRTIDFTESYKSWWTKLLLSLVPKISVSILHTQMNVGCPFHVSVVHRVRRYHDLGLTIRTMLQWVCVNLGTFLLLLTPFNQIYHRLLCLYWPISPSSILTSVPTRGYISDQGIDRVLIQVPRLLFTSSTSSGVILTEFWNFESMCIYFNYWWPDVQRNNVQCTCAMMWTILSW